MQFSWKRIKQLDAFLFAAAVKQCEKYCRLANMELTDAEGCGDAVFTRDSICFNGADGEGGETFCITQNVEDGHFYDGLPGESEGGMYSEFCDTEGKPYGKLVEACLWIINYYLHDADFQFELDTGADTRNWQQIEDDVIATLAGRKN